MAITSQWIVNGRVLRVEFETEDEAPEAISTLLGTAFGAFGNTAHLELGGMTPKVDGFVDKFELWAQRRVIRK